MTTGKDPSLSDLKNNPNYDFFHVLNDEQNDNAYINERAFDSDSSPLNAINSSCNY